MKCLVCKSDINHPVRTGRRSLLCSPKCRAEYKRAWRKAYDSQDHVKAAKAKREKKKYWRDKELPIKTKG